VNKDYRLQLTTKDGSLVMNRSTDKSMWRWQGKWYDDKMIRLLIEKDCREKGVRLVSYTMHDDYMDGIVEWL
jgi:hypothetical protein